MNSPRTGRLASFHIRELDCAEEVKVLRQTLADQPGIGHLDFDVLQGRMDVTYDERVTSQERIVHEVAAAGMHARPWAGAREADDRQRRASWGRVALTTAAGLATLAGFLAHAWQAGSWLAAWGHAAERVEVPLPWASRIAYGLAIAWGLWYVAPRAWASLKRLRPDMHLLMCVAVAGALVLGEWLEAAMVSFLFALSLLLEQYSVGRARRAIAALMDLAPPRARCRRADGDWETLPVEQVAPGRVIRVLPGEKIPLDGQVVEGQSEVNQAPITGESLPQAKEAGSPVYAGTLNGDGTLEIEVTRSADDSTLARIIHMIEQARSRRARSEQWVERFAHVYTPAVMGLAIAVALLPPLVLGGAWSEWSYNALVLLVIACPCALVISTPVSIVSALTASARHGVLVKGGRYLEACADLACVVFDKTGTLTTGRPAVQQVQPLPGTTADQLIADAAGLEAHSTHPLAEAIRRYAEVQGVTPSEVSDFRLLPGKGAEGRIAGRSCWIGNRRLLRERLGETVPADMGQAFEDAGHSVVAVGDDQRLYGLISVKDQVRPQSRSTVAALRGLGVDRVWMLTGDNRQTAEEVARATSVDDLLAEALPEDKMRHVERLSREHQRVAMVGDGVNDGPAMAAAEVGVAMGAVGTDAALEAADVALMADDLSKLPWLIRHARRTRAIIQQNIALALGLKLLFVALALLGQATLWMAIAADMGASLLVIFNGLRLLGNVRRSPDEDLPEPAADGPT